MMSFAPITAIVNPFPQVQAGGVTVTNILNIVFGIVGALTFLFIVYGGFKYVMSRGDPQATNTAKNTIIYAVVGMIITLSAAAIVNFVFGRI